MAERLLLIAPLFFNYYKDIINESELLGFETDYICDAPSNSNFSKAIGRIDKNLIKGSTKRYFLQTVLPSIRDKKYRYILIIAGMTFSFDHDMVKTIRELNPDACCVMYQWDSERNLPYAAGIHPYMDRVYSFDRYDCMRSSVYRFLPLFYTRIYEEIGKSGNAQTFEFDCSYVGTAHPQKYRDINAIAEAVKDILPKQMIYHYMPSRLKYVYHKLLSPEYRDARLREFHMEKIPPEDMMRIFRQSEIILDAPQAGQTGLTIRTIECLGAKRKMITTNADIRHYDFFRETNILVFNGAAIDTSSSFFTAPYEDIGEELYRQYSLRNWLTYMLFCY